MTGERAGIFAAGTFVADSVKLIDAWPEQDGLASILGESRGNGGGPYNLLKDLRRLGFEEPLEACGLVGDDDDGAWIRADCGALGIDTRQLAPTAAAPTSYTYAMTVQGTGRRTFFHQRGANALLSEDHIDLSETRAKLFYLGYIMLLDEMDRLEDGTTGTARVLARARDLGLVAAVDCVTSNDPSFPAAARAALPHADLFFANELEAGRLLGRAVSADAPSLHAAAAEIARLGCPGLVILHCPAGACAADAGGLRASRGSVELPPGFVRGATGAGDAFAAGFLHTWHDGGALEAALELGLCAAAASLSDATSSEGVRAAADCRALGSSYGYRAF